MDMINSEAAYIEDVNFYGLEVGKIYSVSYRINPMLLFTECHKDSERRGLLLPEEIFFILDKSPNRIGWIKILTPKGRTGWIYWDIGTRFDRLS